MYLAPKTFVRYSLLKKVINLKISKIPINSSIGKLLRFLLNLIPRDYEVPILQGKLKGQKWIVGSSNHGCWLGSYEYEKRLRFEGEVQKDSVVYDIGANVGFYTLLASKLVGGNGKG